MERIRIKAARFHFIARFESERAADLRLAWNFSIGVNGGSLYLEKMIAAADRALLALEWKLLER